MSFRMVNIVTVSSERFMIGRFANINVVLFNKRIRPEKHNILYTMQNECGLRCTTAIGTCFHYLNATTV